MSHNLKGVRFDKRSGRFGAQLEIGGRKAGGDLSMTDLPWLELSLPAPPSVNRFMAKLGNRSPVVRRWIRQADMAFTLERSQRVITKIIGRYEAEFTFCRPGDLSNRVKPLEDYLERVEIIENDALCERIECVWGAPAGRVIVRLRPWLR